MRLDSAKRITAHPRVQLGDRLPSIHRPILSTSTPQASAISFRRMPAAVMFINTPCTSGASRWYCFAMLVTSSRNHTGGDGWRQDWPTNGIPNRLHEPPTVGMIRTPTTQGATP